MIDLTDPLVRDALENGPLLMQTCRADHGHSAIACYEERYGIILSDEKRLVHVLRETDAPLNTSSAFLGDPLDIVTAMESVGEAIADQDDDERLTA